MADTRQSILLDPPREVDVPAIEKELTALWKQAAQGSSTDDAPVVRACTLNLIIVTDSADRTLGLEEIIGQVTVDHPSRIFLISTDQRSSASGIDAWVSARCSLPVPGGKQVCCEEINLNARGVDGEKVPSIVTSLLVADIPTILIWKATLNANDTVLQSLAHVSDRVLIDSSEEMSPIETLKEWCAVVEDGRGRTAFGDLAWTHLDHWRSFLAQAFQPAEARSHLSSLVGVSIEYSSSRVPVHSGLSQSLLVSGWLAHSLRWSPVRPFVEGNGSYGAEFGLNGHTIAVEIKNVPQPSSTPGRIESITLHSAQGGEISFHAGTGEHCITMRSSLAGMMFDETFASVHHETEAEIVSRELEVLYNDPMYEASAMTLSKSMMN